MRISVDNDRCEGHGLCAEQAHEVFELDDDGNLRQHYADRELPAVLEAKAARAANICPVAALRLID